MSIKFIQQNRNKNIKIVDKKEDLDALEKEFLAIGTSVNKIVKKVKVNKPEPKKLTAKEIKELEELEFELTSIKPKIVKTIKKQKPKMRSNAELKEIENLEIELHNLLNPEKKIIKNTLSLDSYSLVNILFYRQGKPKRFFPTKVSKLGSTYYLTLKDFNMKAFGKIPFQKNRFYNTEDDPEFRSFIKYISECFKAVEKYQTSFFISSYVSGF